MALLNGMSWACMIGGMHVHLYSVLSTCGMVTRILSICMYAQSKPRAGNVYIQARSKMEECRVQGSLILAHCIQD